MFSSFGVSHRLEERFANERAVLMKNIERSKEEHTKLMNTVTSLEQSL